MTGAARLREALADLLDWAEHIEGEGRLRRTEALAGAREALAAVPEAPEPVYEWRTCGLRVSGMEWVGPARVWLTSVLSELPDLLRQNADVWIERRVVVDPGPWERVEEGTER